MKKNLFIAVIFMAILPYFGKGFQSSCFAQSMASESLWDKADETGYYGRYSCDYCGEVFEGNDQDELDTELGNHIWEEHYEELTGDYSDDDSYDNDEPNPSPTPGEYNDSYIDVINIEYAADVAQWTGIDNKQNFLNKYNSYSGKYVSGNIISLSNFINFIQAQYGAQRIYNLDTVTNNNYNYDYFVLYKFNDSGSFHYFHILTMYDYIDPTKSYEYIFIFNLDEIILY